MPFSSFQTQPSADTPYAAYRPIIFDVVYSGTDPVLYCDIYFNGIFYKTQAKTQDLPGSAGVRRFDIQDAAQEFLNKYIAPNGGSSIMVADPLVAQCYVKIRGSSYDTEGFIVPQAAIPVQATGDTNPTAGGGSASGTFYVVNASLQHENSQDLPTHLTAYEVEGSTWASGVYPLSHRPNHYKLCPGDSDYFPILSNQVPTSVNIHWRPKGGGDFVDGEGPVTCVPIGALNPSLPDALVGEFYQVIIPLSGTGPFSLLGSVSPSWMTITVVAETLVLEGTPTDTDEGTGVQVSATVTNCDGDAAANFTRFINVISCDPVTLPSPDMPDARAGQAYTFSVALGGDPPFVIDGGSWPAWMTPVISGSTLQFTGTPTSDDVDTGVTVIVTIQNCSGTEGEDYSDTIDILPSNNFVANAALNFTINDITGTNVPSPSIFPTPLNGSKKGHHTGLSGSYLVTVTGIIVTTTKLTVYVNGSPVDCWLMGNIVGTSLSGATHSFSVTATEDDNVVFSIENGNC